MPSTRTVNPARLAGAQDAVGDCVDVGGGAPGGNHHGIRDGGLAFEVDGEDVLCLRVVQAVHYSARERFKLRRGGVGGPHGGHDELDCVQCCSPPGCWC